LISQSAWICPRAFLLRDLEGYRAEAVEIVSDVSRVTNALESGAGAPHSISREIFESDLVNA
jgi:hypothetical protein